MMGKGRAAMGIKEETRMEALAVGRWARKGRMGAIVMLRLEVKGGIMMRRGCGRINSHRKSPNGAMRY